MEYTKVDDKIVLTLEKDDAEQLRDAILSSCIIPRRHFFNLKRFIEESYPDLK
jgi:hypothetical protein